MLVGVVVVSVFLVMFYSSGNVEAANVYAGGSYISGMDGEIGTKMGLEFEVSDKVDVLADVTYYSPAYGHLFIIRTSGAYDLTPFIEKESYKVRLLGGPAFFLGTGAEDDMAANADIHLGGIIEEKRGERVSIRSEWQYIPGIFSDMDAAVEITGGAVFEF